MPLAGFPREDLYPAEDLYPGASLSTCATDPAVITSTVFPAVAGLPKTEKIRIYAKAMTGQEEELLLNQLEGGIKWTRKCGKVRKKRQK